jgi:predicted aspartyl protease
MLDDEETTLHQLNELCGGENLFSYARVPRRRMPVEAAPAAMERTPDHVIEGPGANREEPVRSKILSHFVKGKIALMPMETMMMILGELEHMENLVKVARKKKDAEAGTTQVSTMSAVPALRRLYISKTHRSKTLHLTVEVNQCLIDGLVDTGASMSVMAAAVVRELGLMHLVSGSETYKTASGAITQALGRISEIPIKVGEVKCKMAFMVVDTDGYDILLGLDLLIKIGAVVDVEQGLIQVRKGPGTDVEVLPLAMVNLIQKSDLVNGDSNKVCARRETPREPEWMNGTPDLSQESSDRRIVELESESDSNSDEDTDDENQTVDAIDGQSEFDDTELEELILLEGPR